MYNFYDSILINGYNPAGVLFTFLLWCIMLILSKPTLTYKRPARNINSNNTTLFFFLFTIVCILGLHRFDTYHIDDVFSGIYDHYEPVHQWIRIKLASEKELVYRFFIFGGSVAILYYLAWTLDCLNRNFSLVCTLFLVDSMFPEMRGTIGYILLLLGVVLIGISSNNKVRLFWGLFLAICSFFFHRSVFILQFFALLSIFPFERKKAFIIVSWIIFPLLTILINRYFSSILLSLQAFDYGEMSIADSIIEYGESDFSFGEFNLTGLLTRAFVQAPLFIVFFYLTHRMCFTSLQFDNITKYLFRLYYICFYLGCLFSFVETSVWISVRIKVMALFPLPFILTKVWSQEQRASLWTQAIIVIGIAGNILSLLLRYKNWQHGLY